MGQVINMTKWKRWRDLKRRVSAGQIYFPPLPVISPVRPTTDASIAIGYALAGVRERLFGRQHTKDGEG